MRSLPGRSGILSCTIRDRGCLVRAIGTVSRFAPNFRSSRTIPLRPSSQPRQEISSINDLQAQRFHIVRTNTADRLARDARRTLFPGRRGSHVGSNAREQLPGVSVVARDTLWGLAVREHKSLVFSHEITRRLFRKETTRAVVTIERHDAGGATRTLEPAALTWDFLSWTPGPSSPAWTLCETGLSRPVQHCRPPVKRQAAGAGLR